MRATDEFGRPVEESDASRINVYSGSGQQEIVSHSLSSTKDQLSLRRWSSLPSESGRRTSQSRRPKTALLPAHDLTEDQKRLCRIRVYHLEMEKAREMNHRQRVAWLAKQKKRDDTELEAKLHLITEGSDELSIANTLLSTKENERIKRQRSLHNDWEQEVYLPISARIRAECGEKQFRRRKRILRQLHEAYLTYQEIPFGMEDELRINYSMRGITDPIKARTRLDPTFRIRPHMLPATQWTTRSHFPSCKDQHILRRLHAAPCPSYTPCCKQPTQPVHYGRAAPTVEKYQAIVESQYFKGGLRKFPGRNAKRNPLALGVPKEE